MRFIFAIMLSCTYLLTLTSCTHTPNFSEQKKQAVVNALALEDSPKLLRERVEKTMLEMIKDGVIFRDDIPLEIVTALKDFQSFKVLPNAMIYGDSLRGLKLHEKNFSIIDKELKGRKFKRIDSCVHYYDSKKCMTRGDGEILPMIVYIHEDGSLVRAKPLGEPESKFRPYPSISKSVRYPYNAPYDNFRFEAFKLDDEDHPLPKWPMNLRNPYLKEGEKNPSQEAIEFSNLWGTRVHFFLYP